MGAHGVEQMLTRKRSPAQKQVYDEGYQDGYVDGCNEDAAIADDLARAVEAYLAAHSAPYFNAVARREELAASLAHWKLTGGR